MAWLTLTFRSDPRVAADLADRLAEAGALAVTLQDGGDAPVLEPDPGEAPLWAETLVEGLFEAEEPTGLLARLEAGLAGAGLPEPVVGHLEDREWVREGLAGLRPLRFGERLWVCPSWLEPPDPAAVNLRLDPGLAFGTGGHPSTALCLEWLASTPLEGATIVDYGAGSGILAVAALLLGARSAWAVDHDPQALLATRANAERNGVAARLRTCAPEDLPAVAADRVVANLVAGPLVALAPRLSNLVRPGGSICLSGLLTEQADAVAWAYPPALALRRDGERDGWCRLVGHRPPGESS
jgi:ribosomal protein L11 methyltransferase